MGSKRPSATRSWTHSSRAWCSSKQRCGARYSTASLPAYTSQSCAWLLNSDVHSQPMRLLLEVQENCVLLRSSANQRLCWQRRMRKHKSVVRSCISSRETGIF